MPTLKPLPVGKAKAFATIVTSDVDMFNLLPLTIAVAFALATAFPSVTLTLLPVTDKLHLPIIVTLPVAIFNDLITDKDFQKLFTKSYTVIKATNINDLYGSMKKVKKTDTKNVFKLFYTMKSSTGVNCSTRTSHLSQSDLEFILEGNEEYREEIFKSEINNNCKDRNSYFRSLKFCKFFR